jgi:tetratricopeptide (TPR) repeat protein
MIITRLLLSLGFVVATVIGCASGGFGPARVAEIRALEAESAARLVAEGELSYQADSSKKDGYAYCTFAFGLIEQGELRRGIREASKALFLGQTSGNRCLLASAQRDLALAYNFAGRIDRAKEFAEAALRMPERAATLSL